jgi:cytochrome c oxidase subunit 4
MATEHELQQQDASAATTHEHEHPGPAEYVKVATIRAVVTAIEVGFYYITGLPDAALSASLLVMMVVKFAMVALWFMHLKFDSRLFRRLFITGIVLALAIYTIVLLTFGLLLG